MIKTNVNDNILKPSKFGIKDKIGYSFGNFGNEMTWDLVGMYLMVFYTDVLGINPALTGSLMVFARTWDAFMDIIAGRYIDSRSNTKNGKYKPIVLRFCIPMFIFSILMFVRIPGLSNQATIVIAFAAYIIFGTIHSYVTIPFGASVAAITDDQSERSSLSTFRTLGGSVGKILITTFIPILGFVNNKIDANRFFWLAVGLSIIGVISYILYYHLVTERFVVNRKSKQKSNIFISLKGLIKNRSFISFLVISTVLLAAYTAQTTLATYLFKDYLGNAKAMAGNGIIMVLNIVLIAPLVAPLSKKFGKKESSSVAILSSALGFFILFLLPSKNAYLFVVLLWVANAGYTYFSFILWAFLTDIGDEQELITGLREDGTVYSIFNYGRKIGQSLATAFAGFALSAAGYVKAAQQTVEVSTNIKVAATLGPAILYLIVFLALQFWYPMNKAKLAQIEKDLKVRRAEN